ncbi:sugar phosphate isomerase/epimerase family protein [Conexibacter arvalis]|uniref:Sugar phosphate isomerase/epimerase n=1 Tax=Conexibacter arvalis TaxID=912552 RepID=A0A840IK11_9ACTN|nr:TIM barrel protein [Conexibacter arvalis]MBB4664483.1 sugar phosphate isomerase/epimerase [Conexibacter arvalis]
MSDVAIQRHRERASEPLGGVARLGGRLGLDVPREGWPTAPGLKRLEACGYGWVQLHAPPVEMLADPVSVRRHADCLRAVLAPTSLRVVLHAPDDLRLGMPPHDRAFEGLLDCAVRVAANIVVCHAGCFPLAEGVAADRVEDRRLAEERSLRRAAARAERVGVAIAVENLAPAYPVPPARRELAHSVTWVHELVRRLDSPAVGLALDLGHAHLTAQLDAEARDRRDGGSLTEAVAAALDEVVLFHVHDNLGARRGPGTPPGIVPLRLDLHLPPGRGTLPWRALAPLLRTHDAPLLMEIATSHRPDPLRLATVSAELLTRS